MSKDPVLELSGVTGITANLELTANLLAKHVSTTETYMVTHSDDIPSSLGWLLDYDEEKAFVVMTCVVLRDSLPELRKHVDAIKKILDKLPTD